MSVKELTVPISEDAVRSLHVGDTVRLSGVIVTGRDAAHKYMIETFVRPSKSAGQDPPAIPDGEREVYRELKRRLRGSVIYHCGPVVRQREEERWEFVAAGPTTSIREEVYEPDIIEHFGLRGVVGKGGMGPDTLRACRDHGGAYFHAVGGAASLIADAVQEVITVYKKDTFGVPEAFWIIQVEDFPLVVTMDTHGESIHDQVEAASRAALDRLVGS